MIEQPQRLVFCFELFVVGMPLLISGQGCLKSAKVEGYVKEAK